MIYSMTGFGRASTSCANTTITIEIATVNRKQFDASINLPRELLAFDAPLQAKLKQIISRGAIKVNVTIAQTATEANTETVKPAIDRIQALAKSLGIDATLTLRDLLSIPEVTRSSSSLAPTPELYAQIEETLHAATDALQTMRAHEGAAMAQDLQNRLTQLAAIQDQIQQITPTLPALYKETLQKRITELLPQSVSLDPEALAKEVALFADKCDVTEEMTRLKAHFDHAQKIFADDKPCGRPLDFLCQEMFREINTTGSKANNATIAHHVIAFKALLETFREQVQNIE